MAVSDEIDYLHAFQSLKRIQEEFLDVWYEDSQMKIKNEQFLRHNHQKKTRENANQLLKEVKKYEVKTQKIPDFSTPQRFKLKELDDEITKLSDEIKQKDEEVNKEKENVESVTEMNEQKLSDIAAKESHLNKKIEELEKGISYFEEYLGLKLERFEDSYLKFTFTCIDESDQNRKFWFTLQLEGVPGVYKVLECSPEISGCQDIVNELNETNSLKKFLWKMRKEFKLTCNPSN